MIVTLKNSCSPRTLEQVLTQLRVGVHILLTHGGIIIPPWDVSRLLIEEKKMTHPYHHAVSSAKKWGGDPKDYLEIHQWFDESKESLAHFVHRAVRHHAEGIFEAERKFGTTITISTGK